MEWQKQQDLLNRDVCPREALGSSDITMFKQTNQRHLLRLKDKRKKLYFPYIQYSGRSWQNWNPLVLLFSFQAFFFKRPALRKELWLHMLRIHASRNTCRACFLQLSLSSSQNEQESLRLFSSLHAAIRLVNGTFQGGRCLPRLKHKFPMNLHTRAIEMRCAPSSIPPPPDARSHTHTVATS